MKYILDSSAVLYMLESFPRVASDELWCRFEKSCNNKETISVAETIKLLEETELTDKESSIWIKENQSIFEKANQKEAEIIGKLVTKGIFDFYNRSEDIVRKLPFSIPFMIAKAIKTERTVVVYKKCKDKYKIEEICKKLKINCIGVEDYLMEIK